MGDELSRTRKTIIEAIAYAVAEEHREAAEDLVEIYREDRIALSLLHEFYSFLPEAREDWIREIRLVNRHRGIFLLAAVAGQDAYLYLVSSEGIEFQGSCAEGFLADELLDFFGYESARAFTAVSARLDALPVHEPLGQDEDICPACHAEAGSYHELGCPVEICPWCGGQLIHCSCRFDRLGLDSLASEEELQRFEAILEEQGRIPYSREQRPNFVGEGPGIVFD